MKSIKRFAKKTLSLVLCLAMVMTTVIFFEIGIPKTQAAVTTTDVTDMNDVLFYVPEAIYLRPHSDSWTAGTTSTFHFFIENNVTNGADLVTSPSPNTSTPTTGNVYFQYSDADGKDSATNVQLSYRWLSSDLGSDLGGNGIRLGSTDVGVNQNLALSKASGTNYYKTTIIAANSKSPHLAAGETGCYIEWTAKFHDIKDNLDKSVTAYTYVYKPNVVPLGGAAYTKEAEGSNSYHSSLSWLTGFHNIASSATGNGGAYYGRYTTTALGSFGFMPFQTRAGAEAINDNTAGAVGSVLSWNLGDGNIDAKSSLATQDTLYFASTNTTYAYFKANQENSTFANTDSFNWAAENAVAGTSATGATTYSIRNFVHTNQQSDSSDSDNRRRSVCIDNNAVASLVVDTSRYTNLAYVPNLGVGMLYCNDEGTDGGMWYVADYTGRTNSQSLHDYSSGGDYASTALQNNWDDHGNFIIRVGNVTDDRPGDGAYGIEEEDVKYAGAWDSAILETGLAAPSVERHKVKTATYTHDDGEEGSLITVIFNMDVQPYNKSMLRTAVANAQKEFALLGIYDNNYNSHYYNNTGAYTTFVNAYKTACHALAAVNTTITNPDTLAINLNNALSALKAEKDVYETDENGNVTYKINEETGEFELDTNDQKIPVIKTDSCRKSGIAYQYNAGVIRNADGTYRIVKITGASNPEIPYNLGDKVEFTADTYTGYRYIGAYKMISNLNFDALADEGYDVTSVPALTTADNRVNNGVSQSSGGRTTAITATSNVSTSTAVATFSGSTVTYPYAYDTDISYLYLYELTDAEVIFGNEFDFDKYRWVDATGGTSQADHVNNTVTFTAASDNTDGYTNGYNRDQKGYMTLVPGRTYEFSCDYQNLSGSEADASMFLFTLDTAPTSPSTSVSLGTYGTDHKNATASVAANGSGKLTGTITVPAGRPYATIRVGTHTPGVSIKFSNIVVRDITTFTTPLLTNTITMPDPLYKSGAVNAEITGFPTISRPGYVFAGWSTVREANGNGAAANIVTTTTVPATGNRTLYPVWQTNVIYDTDGGLYRKSSDPMQTSYQVEGRWNVPIGTSVPVSNRVVQGQTGWDSVDVNYTYVPYKPGYNFKGWLANSVDPAVDGKVYWPTQPVVTNSNVEFTAVWEEAASVELNSTNRITSSSNDGNRAFYPGQVHFYKYTPATNQYASAYTYNSEGDLDMQAFDNAFNFVAENDNHEYSYGIQDIAETDPMITMNLTAGETYYAGITMHSITGTIAGGTNFRIQEHTVKYTLLPNGGTINGSNQTQSVIGYSNIDTELPSTGEKYGYDFSGWLSEETPAKSYAAGEKVPGVDNYNRINGYTVSLVRDIYLTAQWSPKPFSIIYDKNIPANATPTDASPMPATGTLRYATDGAISEIVPSMAGYTFKGWATTADKVEGEKLYQKGEAITASTATAFFDANNGGSVTLYARWAPNLIIVRFKPGAGTGEDFTQNFWYDQEQQIDTQNFDPEKYSVGFYEVGTTEAIETLKADLEFDGWQDVETGTPTYTYANGAIIKNPNGVTGISDTEGVETILYAKWKGGVSTVTTPVWVSTGDTHVLAGWSTNSDASTLDYAVGEAFAPKGDMKLYAVWYPVDTAEDVIQDFSQYDKNASVVTGIEYTNAELTEYKEIKSQSEYPVYDNVAFKAAVQRYENARAALKNNATAENNREYYEAIKDVEAYFDNPPVTKAPITSYLTQFEIKYAEGVTGKVPAGQYSLTDMNLNHYATQDLDDALAALTEAKAVENMLNQSIINRSVVTMANAYANPQDVKTSTPVYTVYDTPESLKESGLIEETEGITSVNYVYTGKGNYTYYCYTNSKTPTMLLTVDEDKTADGRYCYPTTAQTVGDVVMTNGASTEMPEIRTASDNKASSVYNKYLAKNMGTADGRDASYYQKRAVVELNPDFSTAGDKATVAYTITARDDAYAPTAADINYADSAKLTSGAAKGNLTTIPDTAVTPENTITIIIDYHAGEGFDVTGKQVGDDEWLKQYHLARSSGGASNWELPVSGDSVYTVYDETYGQTDYGSFTYTFNVGAENDFANCVLASAEVEDVIATVKENYAEMKAVAFDGAQELFKWQIIDGNWKFAVSHAAGTGLGYKAWPNTNWSFNYYPTSGAYTYVHLVDRWGNTVDKVIQVPNLDGSAAQVHPNGAGAAEVIEQGGSGLDTMSLSAESFEIITDENSMFDGETYTTTGNTVTVYTGEANKKYTLAADDVATNSSSMEVMTDENGYLTIAVEDKAYEEGVYTFSLNGTQINLYAEVEKNVISATGDSVEKGMAATIEVVTTDKVTTVQLVSETGSTTTLDKYVEDADGNRVWTVSKNKDIGEYTYSVRIKTADGWTTEGDTVTVTVTEPTIFVGAVTNVEYTPSTSTRNEFMFTVTGRPDKIQVIEPDGGTRTYDRYHAKVIIVSYDENGNVIGALSRELSYEVWTIEMNVPAETELTAIARYGRNWSKDAPYKYTVVLATPEFDDEVYSMSLESAEGSQGKVAATVVTGLDVEGVRFVMDDNTTSTYYFAEEADGKLTYSGYAWINHAGDNIIIVKIRVNNAWVNAGELNYYAI